MSEEVKDAGIVVPRAMITSFIVNGIMGLIALIAFLFAIPSLGDALVDPSGYPFLYVMRSHLSDGVTTGITVVIVLLALAGNTDFNASASRQAFALARDNGFPFSKWISHVSQHTRLFFSIGPPHVIKIAKNKIWLHKTIIHHPSISGTRYTSPPLWF